MKWLIDRQDSASDSVGTISNSTSRLFFHRSVREDSQEYASVYDSAFDLLSDSDTPEYVFRWSKRTEAVLLRYLNEHFSDGYEHGGLKGLCIL
jgi:hypothetical protein